MSAVQFLKSAKTLADCPFGDRPEVALMGRSNAGKSSFLNALTGQKIAKVSGTPGKTRLLNFFDVGDRYRWIDTPGYGYASRGAQERVSWAQMIEDYVRTRESLSGVLLIMDIRRDWSSDERMIELWLKDRQLPLAILLNKSDKLGRAELNRRKDYFKKSLGAIPFFLISSTQRRGLVEVEEFVFKNWVKK
jgi:GTP-binding protein